MFKGGRFIFDNKSSTEMYDCFIGNINNYDDREIGLLKSIQRHKSNDTNIFHSTEKNHISIPITIIFEKI